METTCQCNTANNDTVTKGKAVLMTEHVAGDLANLFKVFGDPTRVKILHLLSVTELCVCDIANVLDMTQSAISHQLRVLKQAKLVRNRKDGKTVYYALDDDHVHTILRQGLDHISHVL
ncbi:helix-turn-helix transcriptional regulator [Fusibacter paucivorans]|uniref:Helix-turn-helix transcriptional regulator n=1 Tax=Fusibacter paucivorans TaxID=76009 RepID=A0ABS5PUT6_9FIRM|nr:metalloregulator ArsR/SmtB family transcription factor [Fusibacter paucivorans]MBS7528156.1 helix-turn-helix transcriptional regulator [Fusibacter paucivorans]